MVRLVRRRWVSGKTAWIRTHRGQRHHDVPTPAGMPKLRERLQPSDEGRRFAVYFLPMSPRRSLAR